MSESMNGQSRLAVSLAKAQANFPTIKKTRTAKAGAYAYNYADLSDILHAVVPVLAKYELALAQRYSVQEGTILLETMLLHASGEMLSSMLPISAGGTAQQIGSMMTYMRRYGVTALLGIAAEDDDDGASGNVSVPAQRSSEGGGGDLARYAGGAARKADVPRAASLATEKQRKLIWARAKAKGDALGVDDSDVATALKRACSDMGFASRSDITGPAVDSLLHIIEGWTLASFGEPEPPAEQIESGDAAEVPF